MNGSCATICISNARARCATSCPMRPRPTMPSVLPRSSLPVNFFFSHFCAFIAASAAGIGRASARMKAIASSATLMLLAPGAFITTMPRAVAASRSTLSTPVPARAMTRRRGAAAMRSARHLRRAAHDERVGVGERRRGARARDAPARASTVQPGSARSRSAADAGRSSAMTIFMMAVPIWRMNVLVGELDMRAGRAAACGAAPDGRRAVVRVYSPTNAPRWCKPLFSSI